jgi:hypothetical protein
MSSALTWIKKELEFLKDSIPQILKSFILFLLVFSGLGIAIMLRIMGYNGVIITLGGIVIEGVALVLLYIFLKGYFQETSREKDKIPPAKKK